MYTILKYSCLYPFSKSKIIDLSVFYDILRTHEYSTHPSIMSNFVNYLRIRHHRRDENTGTLYTSPVDTVNGSFTFPRTWPLSFRETSTINISWSTKYEGVNLYYYQRGKVAASIQLASKYLSYFQPVSQLCDIRQPI